VVSPFGARGGNGGIQDIDNICWKLAAVLKGEAQASLIESYNEERTHGSAENIKNSSRATNFMTPKSPIEHMFRNEVLKLSKDMPFARKLINSGRLSVPCSLAGMTLQNGDETMIGRAVVDASLDNDNWLVSLVQGEQFTLVGFGDVSLPHVEGVKRIGIEQLSNEYQTYKDISGHALKRYDAGFAYLFRPDGHVMAVFETPVTSDVRQVLDKVHAPQIMREVA